MEPDCIAITTEKKYYNIEGTAGEVYVKRNLTPTEYGVYLKTGATIIPSMHFERLKNEAAAIVLIKKKTNIPVPTIRCAFEDNGRYYIITDTVPGVAMARLWKELLKPENEEKLKRLMAEIDGYLHEMRTKLKSKVMGGVLGDWCLPYRLDRALRGVPSNPLMFREAGEEEFVFCHNDLSQHNIILDEKTFAINAIIDWEYSGYYPKEFEGHFWERPGPSVAIEYEKGGVLVKEEDDISHLLSILEKWKRI